MTSINQTIGINDNMTQHDKLQIDLKHKHPPMVSEKEWKALIEDAKENLFKNKEDNHELVNQGTTHVILSVKYDHLCFSFLF